MADSKDYRQILTDRLIEQLESGTAPWQKPWDAKAGIPRRPYNPISGKEYRGANSLFLSMYGRSDPRWCTYKQAAAEGWQVRKGEKGALVEYWKFQEEQLEVDDKGKPVLDPETGKQKTIMVQLERPQVFRAVVFNAEQMDNVPELAKGPRQYEWDPLERAEQILKSSGAAIYHDQNDRAFYSPGRDEIHMPGRDQFPSPQAYYSTALHELGHWTGHESRLARDLTGGFGSQDYAKEELRAELASYFLADKLGIPHEAGGLDQHAAYVKSWIKALKDDKNEIFRASKAAEEITEYVLQLDRERTKEVGLDRGDKGPEIAAQNDEITKALNAYGHAFRSIGDPNADLTRPGYEAERAVLDQLDEVTERHLGLSLPYDWNGDLQVVALVEIKDGDRVNVAPALLHPDRQPEYFGVYAKSDNGPAEWIADRPTLDEANKLAYRLASIHQAALPDPSRKPEVTHSLPEQDLAKERVDLVVPFKDKEAVKALGAKWDTKGKTWYAPEGTDLKPLAKWMPNKVEKSQAADLAADGIAVDGARQLAESAAIALNASFGDDPEARRAETAQARRMESEAYTKLATVDVEKAKALVAAEQSKVVDDPQLQSSIRFDEAKYQEARAKAPAVSVEHERTPEAEQAPAAPAADKTYLAVPFKEKDQARAAGAKWDTERKAWYAPAGADLGALSKWVPKQDLGQGPVDPAAAFLKELREVGLVVEEPIMDGKLHRVPVEGKGKGNRDGAYVGYLDGRPSGFIQNFSTGETRKWKLDGPELSPEEKARLAAEAAIKLQQREKELAQQHEDAAGKAVARWERAAEMQPGEHTPYTTRKQVEAYGVRREGQDMLVPVRDIDGKMWAVQTVFPEKKELVPGTDPIDKVFTKGAKKEGNFHLIGEVRPGEPIITAEGYATGATLHAATGYTVAVAFDSGNLSAVVGALKERYPTNPQFIGADDDRFPKPNRPLVNAGLTKAIAAAEQHKVGVIVPKFAEGSRGTDFNDMQVEQGIGAVTATVDQAISQTMARSREEAAALARQRIGQDAAVGQPGANTRHTGEVVGVTAYHAAQVAGKAAVVHQVKDLDRKPMPGQTATIQYADGKGKVTDRTQEKERQTQLQR